VENDTTYFYAAFAYDSITNISMPAYAAATPNSAIGISEKNSTPAQVYISQNYPNPFNASTKFKIAAPVYSETKITIYNIVGKRINNNQYNLNQSNRTYTFNAENLPSGIYFAKINVYSIQLDSESKFKPFVSKAIKLLLIR